MDIDLLSKMVKELILDNDRVVLPGLGVFVAEIVPSTFSDKGYTINPPYRRLYFRSKPDEGDDLARLYASTNGVDFSVADKVIREFVSDLKSVLLIRKTVVFPGLGRLRATKENAVFFVADEDLDIYPEGMGLEPISLKTHQETKEEVVAAIEELKAIVVADPLEEPAADPIQVPAEELIVELAEEPIVELAEEPLPEPVEVQVEERAVQESKPEDAAKSETVVDNAPESALMTYLKGLLWTAVAAVVVLLIFVLLSSACTQLMDRILYTPEELEILSR